MVCNTAIFYDIENLLGLFSEKTNTVLHLDEIFRRILEIEGVHGVSIQRAYADWAVPQNRNLRNSVLQIGIEPVHVFNTNQSDKLKNAADVSLIIDVVDIIPKRPEIENYVIASGDGIFAFLAKKLHEHGKRVIGCGFENITNIIFRNACDYFIPLEKTDSSLTAKSSKKKKTAVQQTGPETHVIIPEQESAFGNFPKTKYTDALENAEIKILRDSSDMSACYHIIRQIVEAIFVKSTQNLPGLNVSIFANYASYYLPDINYKHGFRNTSEFLRFILTGSPYCISKTNTTSMIIPRESAQGNVLDDVKGLLITSAEGNKYNSVFNVPAGESFIFSIAPPERKIKKAPPKKEPAPAVELVVEGSIRKWIKERFEELSNADVLTSAEVKKMTTAEYSLATFGVRTPILKEIETRSNLAEQRTANGKIKYWKESFRFNGRTYLVYKEWVAGLHQERFIAWLSAFKK